MFVKGVIDYILKFLDKKEFEGFKKDLLEKVCWIFIEKEFSCKKSMREKIEFKILSYFECFKVGILNYLVDKLRESKVIVIGILIGGFFVLEKIFINFKKDFLILILVV